MKYPRNKKNSRGVSIIEIVVAMILLMTVMMSLAFVYPNGRRLTDSSDYRTKATEIAKSIIEEIKLIPFETATAGDDSVANLCLLPANGVDGFIALNSANGLTFANFEDLHWPYHHLNGWDATVADGDNPVCPFFISQAEDIDGLRGNFREHSVRKFCLSVNDLNGDNPRSILVTPPQNTIFNDEAHALNHPSLAIINVTVYWGVSNGNIINVDRVTLTDSRTKNLY